MTNFTEILSSLVSGEPLSPSAAEAAFDTLMAGQVPDAAIGAFLMALKQRGEHVDEIVGGARALRRRAAGIVGAPDMVDTCGTGGGWSSFNVSTAAALVAAGAGVPVAKHGNRTVTRKSGSADVLEALGVNLAAPMDTVQACLDQAGICFLYAPAHHAAMRHVGPARKAMGLRTIFNIIGPLANPAGARRQMVGVNEARLVPLLADALNALGAQRALIVHGSDGLDEITLTGPTEAILLDQGHQHALTLSPEAANLPRRTRQELEGGSPQDNAQAIRAMVNGANGALRDIACINAAGALMVAGAADNLAQGVAQAQAGIDSGAAAAALDALVRITSEVGV